MKVFAVLLLLSLMFLAGILVAHYQLFPYPQLKAVKQMIFPHGHQKPHDNHYFSRKVSQHRLYKDKRFDLVFIGDSLIDEAEWPQFFPGFKVANLGINADTTTGVLDRIETVAQTLSSKRFLMIGVNDIFRGSDMDQIQRNYQSITEALSENTGQVYLFSCLYVGLSHHRYNRQITVLNQFIEKLADQNKSLHYIDLNGVLAPNRYLEAEYTNDGVHLNANGYQQWVRTITPYVNETGFDMRSTGDAD